MTRKDQVRDRSIANGPVAGSISKDRVWSQYLATVVEAVGNSTTTFKIGSLISTIFRVIIRRGPLGHGVLSPLGSRI